MERECKKHGITNYSLRGKSYRCDRCAVEHVTKRRKLLKVKAVEYKGGICVMCGYSKCIGAMEFHHIDPLKKDFHFGTGNTKAWYKVQLELDKCILVCSNCHREIHFGELAPM